MAARWRLTRRPYALPEGIKITLEDAGHWRSWGALVRLRNGSLWLRLGLATYAHAQDAAIEVWTSDQREGLYGE